MVQRINSKPIDFARLCRWPLPSVLVAYLRTGILVPYSACRHDASAGRPAGLLVLALALSLALALAVVLGSPNLINQC